MYFYRFHELTQFSSEIGIKKIVLPFSSSDNIFCGTFRRKFSYSAKIGQPEAWVGLEQISGPRILKKMDR